MWINGFIILKILVGKLKDDFFLFEFDFFIVLDEVVFLFDVLLLSVFNLVLIVVLILF